MTLIAKLSNKGTSTMGRNYSAFEIKNSQKNFSSFLGQFIKLDCLPNSDYKIISPIMFETTFDERANEWVVKYPLLGIFEYGDDLHIAIANFKAYLLDLYDDLMSFDDTELSQELLEQKKIIKTIIEPV